MCYNLGMEPNPQPNPPGTIEQEIAQIEKQLAEKRAALESQKQTGQVVEVPHEKEILREIVREQYAQPTPAPVPVPIQPPTSNIQSPPIVEPPSYLSDELKSQVQQLVDLAFTKSVSDAVNQARATNNAALIDAFHDALVDELYNYLVERGKLQKL